VHGGRTVEEAAKIFMNVLEGKGTSAQNDAVIINSAMAIHCVQPALTLTDCISKAKASLESKKALVAYKMLIKNI
ncbi:MAG: anthranilate phosphoribosyltransferase, partial [Bacteroidia bacterium]|nr:anthranilate phosphoribosyltransferase [Bacteroidia bacterium]